MKLSLAVCGVLILMAATAYSTPDGMTAEQAGVYPVSNKVESNLDSIFCKIPDGENRKSLFRHRKGRPLWHVGENRWTSVKEIDFQEWVSSIEPSFLAKIGVKIDCVDAPIALRMIYSKWKHLPFMAVYLTDGRRGRSKSVFNELSHGKAPREATSKRLKFVPHWDAKDNMQLIEQVASDKQFLAAFEVLRKRITTYDVGLSTFPMKVFKEASASMDPRDFELADSFGFGFGYPITFARNATQNSRHTIFLYRADPVTGLVEQLSKSGLRNTDWMAKEKFHFYGALHRKGVTKGKREGIWREGFHGWRWPVMCNGKWRFAAKKMQPGYAEDFQIHRLQKELEEKFNNQVSLSETSDADGASMYVEDAAVPTVSPAGRAVQFVGHALTYAIRKKLGAKLDLDMNPRDLFAYNMDAIKSHLENRRKFVLKNEETPSTDRKSLSGTKIFYTIFRKTAIFMESVAIFGSFLEITNMMLAPVRFH